MSGVKLTVFVPTINHIVRYAVGALKKPESETFYLLVLCHSYQRCQEIENFLKNLTTFLSDVIDVIGLYDGDVQENLIAFK